MQDEIDPQLRTLFAHANEALPSEAFMKSFLAKMEHAHRVRLLQRAGLIAVILLIGAWFAPGVLEYTAGAVRAAGAAMSAAAAESSGSYDSLIVSPWGWAASTFIGLAVLFRVGALRRRSRRNAY
jgi:hypothetical protein